MRRSLLPFAGLALALALVLPPLSAAASSPARQALETSISRILAAIKNPDYVNPVTRPPPATAD